MCLSKDITVSGITNVGFYLLTIHSLHVTAHTTLPAAAIDITRRTSLDIDISTRHETYTVRTGIITNTMHIHHSSARSGSIDILLHRSTQQSHVGRTGHHSL